MGSALSVGGVVSVLQAGPETVPGWQVQAVDLVAGRLRARSGERQAVGQNVLVREPGGSGHAVALRKTHPTPERT